MSSFRQRTVLFGAVLLLCGSVAGCARDNDADAPARVQVRAHAASAADGEATAGTAPEAMVADGGVLVDVSGHVRRPGVYRLARGARVHEAITAAGGARRGADLAALNRAALLVDGQQVLVPHAGGGGSSARTGGTDGGARTVSINGADAATLDALPGIGPVTAERIVAERESGGPFARVDDLDRVAGIGPATIEALRGVATT